MTEPALTPEEWAEFRAYDGFVWVDAQFSHRLTLTMDDGSHCTLRRPDAVAALALHGQPGGFTHQDVDWLRLIAREGYSMAANVDPPESWLLSLADRLAALLPPR